MKTNTHIPASSLLEAVIAIAIISGCLAIGLTVFVKVTNVQPPVEYYTMDSKLKQNLAFRTDSLGLRIDNNITISKAPNSAFELKQELKTEVLQIVHKTDTLDFTLLTYNKIER